MKHLYLMFLVVFSTVKITQAQTTPTLATSYYAKQKTNVALEDMAGATTLIGPTRIDEQVSAITPISFQFDFVGKSFNAFLAFSSGALVLTNNNISPTSNFQILLPWADALITGDNGHISYKVIGTVNRKLVVEFFMSNYVASTGFPAIADKRFQLWMFENSNQIQFVYGDGTVDAAQAVVGIAGNENNDLLQINTLTNEVTTETTYISTNWPGFGQSYLFSPTEFVAVEPTASVTTGDATTVCEGGSVNLTAVLQDGTALGYQWLKNGLPIAGATNAGFTALETGSYSVQVSHNSGTVSSGIINVFITKLSAAVKSTNITCNAVNNGTISIQNASGANGTYEYSIGNGVWKTSEVFSNLAPATYAVQLRSGSCVKLLGSVVIKDESAPPVVNVTAGNGGACANVTLTAYPANAANYSWSNGETTRSITLDNYDNDGIYKVTVANGNGCSGNSSYVYNKENQLNSYALIVSKGIAFGQNNVVNGSVGNKSILPVYVDKNSTINGFIRSTYTALIKGALVTGGVSNQPVDVALPTVYSNTSVTNALPEKTVADNYTGTIDGNFKNLVVGKNAKVTITGNVFGKIRVKSGGEVSFTNKDISIDDVQTDDGTKTQTTGRYTIVNFAEGTKIRIKNKVDVGMKNRINAAGSTFYLDDVRPDAEKLKIDGYNTIFSGNAIITKGILAVKGAADVAPCVMNGVFICEYVVSDDYVTWNRNVCNTFAPRGVNAANMFTGTSTFKASIYPNPANGAFNLVLKSVVSGNAEVTVANVNGAIVKKQVFRNVLQGKILPVNLTTQPAGIYMLKVITPQGQQLIKVIVKK